MVERIYDRRNTTTPCRWALNSTEPSPHTQLPLHVRPKICSSILDAIGDTPIVRINNITKQENIQCELLVKCEFMNPGGSFKDRVGKRIIEDLETSGRLRQGMKVVEASSGNTGIGLALASIVKGYPLIVTMPEKMSQEKNDVLEAMGVEMIRTPTEAPALSASSYLGVAESLERNNSDIVMAGQHFNSSNSLAHYDSTGEEIVQQLDGKLDYIVLGCGTGGLATGLSRKLKEKIPGITIVAVDPKGSIIHDPFTAVPGPNQVEGLGAGYIPRTCYTDLIDKWIIGDDKVTFEYARKLIRYEGLLVGGSSGLIMYAAVQLAKTLPADKRVLAILPDGVRNYMTKFLNDRWMIQKGFLHEKETPAVVGKTVKDLNIKPSITCTTDCTIRDVVGLMKKVEASIIPLVKDGIVVGVASSSVINKKLIAGTAQLSDPVQKVIVKNQSILKFDTTLAFAAVCLEDWNYAVVQDGEFIGVVYPIDLSLALSS